MIKKRESGVVLLVAVAAVLGACSGDDGADYCKNHYLFHPEHVDRIARLNLEVSAQGDLGGRLTVPRVVVGDMPESDVRQLLGDPERSFALQSDVSCTLSLTEFSAAPKSYNANYAASCGAENRLGKINVALFDHLTDLDEVVVSVTTPATGKHFGISRQCDKPIFRLTKT